MPEDAARASRREFGLALVFELVGAVAALLAASRPWHTVVLHRPRPLADLTVHLSGRTVDAAPTALALVALAGVIAVVAVSGRARQGVGVLVATAGVALAVRAVGEQHVSASRAAALARAARPQAGAAAVSQTGHTGWVWLTVAAAALVVVAGLLATTHGDRWPSLSRRYDRATTRAQDDPEQARARADASLWTALDQGRDPTADPGGDAPRAVPHDAVATLGGTGEERDGEDR